MLAGVLALTGAAAANANTGSISGTQNEPSTVHWTTTRSNTFPSNYVAFNLTTSPPTGASFSLKLKNSSGNIFASGTWSGQGSNWITVYNNNGNPYQPAGTFTLVTYVADGACECSPVYWEGNLQWNVRYN